MKAWSNRKRVVFLAAICVAAAIATVIAVAAIDDFARSEVRTRAEAVYFEKLRKTVAKEVAEKLQRNGCDARAGVEAANRFLAKERRHMSLRITHEPDWGWQVDRYRFTIRWRSTWIAKFKVDDETYEAIDDIVNKEFEDTVKDVVCRPACGRVGCFFGDLFDL